MSTEQHTALTRDALVRELALVHARARAAEYLVREDPVAAQQALRGLTRSSGAVFDAVRTAGGAQPVGQVADAAALAALLGGFRASGGTVRLAAIGPEQQLSPDAEAAVRTLLSEVLAAVDGPGALSVSLTWSPRHLDLLVVLVPPRDARTGTPALGTAAAETLVRVLAAPVTADDLVRSEAAVRAAGGTLRVATPAAGGSVVAAVLPLPAAVGARIGT
jgi:hypothetical protein